MLHSTFWSHGAGDLDLPPWAVAMLQTPADLPFRRDDKRGDADEGRIGDGHKAQQSGQGMTDGIFLDFLYPQQALALLHKRSNQQSQRWEKRNARRLPDGFVVASRGYASRSRTAKAKRAAKEQNMQRAQAEQGADGNSFQTESFKDKATAVQESSKDEWWETSSPGADQNGMLHNERGPDGFADSPLDLADAPPEAIRKLRNIIAFKRKKTDARRQGQEAVEQAWHLYQTADDSGQADNRLRTELLRWLNEQQTEKASAYCTELYHSIPADQRTLEDYEIALNLFLRRDQHLSASKLHREALRKLENGDQISKVLFRYSVENELWRLAIRTEARHGEFYGESSPQMRMFWLRASEIPQLLSKAITLVSFLQSAVRQHSMDPHTQKFCVNFFKEAIQQEFIQADTSLYAVPSVAKKDPPRDRIRSLFARLAQWDDRCRDLFEATLTSLLDPKARFPYPRIHNLVSSIYNIYRGTLRFRPSERLLHTLLDRVTAYADSLHNDKHTRRSLSVQSVVEEWEAHYDRLSVEAHERLVGYFARSGRIEEYEAAMERFKTQYPDPMDWKKSLWTSIYMHARRADLDAAQQAFAAVKRELAEYDDKPDLKCWNVLLHAHARADDLEGALTNLQNLMDHGNLTPDAHSFHAVTEMFAKRGDVDGVEDMIEQYEALTGAPRYTPLLGSLITAFVRSNDIESAEKVLRDTVDKVKQGEIIGPLTKCFNILLTTYAMSRQIDATKRVYRWMREANIELDKDTYSALIFALTLRRQTNAAHKIVSGAMKEAGILPTSYHFGLVMAGYVNVGRIEDAFRVYEEMLRLNVRPTSSSRAIYLQACAMAERRDQDRRHGGAKENMALESTLEDLRRLLKSSDGSTLSPKTPRMRSQSDNLNEADLASHFDYLIFVHGKRRCFEVVKELLEQYQQNAAERGLESAAPPFRLLSALMSAYLRAREYDEVEASWKLAKERADTDARIVQAPLLNAPKEQLMHDGQRVPDALELEPLRDAAVAEPGQDESRNLGADASGTPTPLPTRQTLLAPAASRLAPRPIPGRRHILTRPLRYYLAALYAQNRFHDLITTFSSLLSQGYHLDNRTFNYFIECLCRATPPLALLAFTLTERFLIPNFPGWIQASHRYAYVYGNRPQARAEGLENIRARYLKPGTLMPQYRVLVRLGSVLLDVRRLEAMGKQGMRKKQKGEKDDDLERFVGTMAQVRAKAPKTLYAVQSMPRRPDRLQSRLLRREG